MHRFMSRSAHRPLRKDLVNQKRRALGHTPSTTAGTETVALAVEGDQVPGMQARRIGTCLWKLRGFLAAF